MSAVAAAAHGVLWATLPAPRTTVDARYAAFMAGIADSAAKTIAIALGETVANGVIAARAGDATTPAPQTFRTGPGQHEQTFPYTVNFEEAGRRTASAAAPDKHGLSALALD
jgi:hypothetical protein